MVHLLHRLSVLAVMTWTVIVAVELLADAPLMLSEWVRHAWLGLTRWGVVAIPLGGLAWLTGRHP